jgi:hypothetical protein
MSEKPKTPFEMNVRNWAEHPELYAALPDKEYVARGQSLTVEQLDALVLKDRAALPKAIKFSDIALDDMPESVLQGRLGDICRTKMADFPRAYAWLPILSAASVHIEPDSQYRANINVCIIGPSQTGKSGGGDRATKIFSTSEYGLSQFSKHGSAEGLFKLLDKKTGQPLLWNVGELSHMLEKANIQGASFLYHLNDLFFEDSFDVTVAKGQRHTGRVRLSILGGVVDTNFDKVFGSGSVGGTIQRFLFGVCPPGYKWHWRPFKEEDRIVRLPFDAGNASLPKMSPLKTPPWHDDVFEARDAIEKSEGLDLPMLQLVLRCATISAAWDGLTELRASYLAPFWELARYEQKVRALFPANEGGPDDAIISNKILALLSRYPNDYVNWRDVYRKTRIIEKFGPNASMRAMWGLKKVGKILVDERKPATGGYTSFLLKIVVED